MAFDPDFDKVSLLLHCDGADGSTVFTDSRAAPKTVTAYGNAKISAAQSKWGGASAYFDGSGDYLSAPASADYTFGTGDFTVELWINTTTTAEDVLVDQYRGTDSWQLSVKDGKLSWYGKSDAYVLTSLASVNDGTWHHVAATREAGVLRFFVDGAASGQATDTTGYSHSIALGIGAQAASRNPSYDYDGYIDDLRITKGVARYTANFTPPTEPFPNSAPLPTFSAYAAAATPLGAPAALALQHPLAARIAAPTPLGAAQALIEFNGTSKARIAAASPLGQPTAVAVAVMQATARADTPLGAVAAVAVAITPVEAHAAAATPLGAAQALAYAPPTGNAAAPTPLGAAQVTAYAMVAGYAASPTPLGQPAALAFADMAALGTVGQNTAFGNPALVLVNRVQDGIRLAEFIPPLTALQGMAPGSMTSQASSLPSPAFGTPAVQFATSHEAASLESAVAFGAPAVRSIHAAESLEPAQFGDVGAPAFAAHAASLQDGVQLGQPLASTLHALPDWYAGLRFGAVAVQGTGVFPVLDGIELGEFGLSESGATRHQAMPLHMLPQFGPVTISRGAMTC